MYKWLQDRQCIIYVLCDNARLQSEDCITYMFDFKSLKGQHLCLITIILGTIVPDNTQTNRLALQYLIVNIIKLLFASWGSDKECAGKKPSLKSYSLYQPTLLQLCVSIPVVRVRTVEVAALAVLPRVSLGGVGSLLAVTKPLLARPSAPAHQGVRPLPAALVPRGRYQGPAVPLAAAPGVLSATHAAAALQSPAAPTERAALLAALHALARACGGGGRGGLEVEDSSPFNAGFRRFVSRVGVRPPLVKTETLPSPREIKTFQINRKN